MKSKFNLIILASIIIVSCGGNKEDIYVDSREIYKEAIKIHDEVMPLMGEIMRLQNELKIEKDKTDNSEHIQKINESIQKLEEANHSMMVWMRTLTPVPENKEDNIQVESELPSASDMLEVQKSSLESVKVVKDLILSSIEEGSSLLESL